MKPSLIVTLADKNYINHAKQLFSSVYWNAGWKGDYMLLAHEIPEVDLIWFRKKGILIKECKNFGHVTLDKFYLFTPEFKKWSIVIFLDVDMIVRYSLYRLLSCRGFNAVPESHNCLLKDQFSQSIDKEFDLNSRAFNTGVMVFSSDIISADSFATLQSLTSKYQNMCKFAEQPLLNLFFYKKWKRLGFLYNVFIPILTERYHVKASRIDGIILHFLGPHKPWHPDNPFYQEWKINLDGADLIDLNNRQKGRVFKMTNMIFYNIYYYCNRILWNLYYFIDRQIGRIGIFLRK